MPPSRRPRRPPAGALPESDSDDASQAAREAGLRYVSDDRPGFRRVRAGRGFRYLDPAGRPLRDPDALARIRSLAIPPAWSDVWISPDPSGHLQATGRDARRRKQYRYHPRFRSARDEAKFERILAFAAALPRIRARVDADLARPGLPREKVLALVVRLLDRTLIRVGNDEYARSNRSFGLTTLRDRHVRVDGSTIRFRFRGKGGRAVEVDLRDRRLAGLVRRCQELPGQELFQYLDPAGEPRDVRSEDVNDYIRAAGGSEFSAKDFRTWHATVLAYRALRALEPEPGRPARPVVRAVRQVAERLGNTAAVARASYVHPAVLEAYTDGQLGGALVEAAEEQGEPPPASSADEEAAVVEVIRQRLLEERERASARPSRPDARGRPTRRRRDRQPKSESRADRRTERGL